VFQFILKSMQVLPNSRAVKNNLFAVEIAKQALGDKRGPPASEHEGSETEDDESSPSKRRMVAQTGDSVLG